MDDTGLVFFRMMRVEKDTGDVQCGELSGESLLIVAEEHYPRRVFSDDRPCAERLVTGDDAELWIESQESGDALRILVTGRMAFEAAHYF